MRSGLHPLSAFTPTAQGTEKQGPVRGVKAESGRKYYKTTMINVWKTLEKMV